MAAPTLLTARSRRSAHRLLLKLLSGWVLLSLACSLPSNPFARQDPLAVPASDPTPTAAFAALPTPLPQVPPVLVETRPLPGSPLNTRAGITFYFSQPMDRASVESAVVITPEVPGGFDWQDDATLVFAPESLPPGETLRVAFAASARAQNGLALAAQPELTYQSPRALELLEHQPASSSGVDPGAAVVAVFNQPVVALSAEDRSQPPAFTLDPPAPGRGEWINTSTYVFYPAPALAGGVQYTASLNPELTSTSGSLMASEQARFRWRFRTTSPSLTYIDPAPGLTLMLDDRITVAFNQPMDPASVEQHLSFSDARGRQVQGSLEWQQNNTRFVFTPAGLFQRGVEYTLRISAEAHTAGGTPLDTPVQAEYRAYRNLAVERMIPEGGQNIELMFGYIFFDLEFNAPLDRTNLSDYFSLDPPVAKFTASSDYNQRIVRFSGDMLPNQRYTLVISPDLKDRWGQPLGQELRLPISTAPARPSLEVPMTYGMWPSALIFMQPGDAQLLAEATNLTHLDLAVAPVSAAETLALFDWSDDFTPPEERLERWRQPLSLPPDAPRSVPIPLSPEGTRRPTGLYYVQIAAPETVTSEYDQPKEIVAVVSRIQLLMKTSRAEVFVWALDLETNQPIAGLPVTLFDSTGAQQGSLVTDADGTGSAALEESAYRLPLYALSGEPGAANFSFASSQWSRGINNWDFGLPYGWSGSSFAYTYTDRPIYMPGQTVRFRANVHRQDNTRYLPAGLDQVTVMVYSDYSVVDQQQKLMAQMALDVSPFGSVTGEFAIPENAEPGTYTLRIDEMQSQYIYFRVAEYRKPEVDLQASFNQDSYLPEDEITLTIDAGYYFGAPAVNQPIGWSLSAVDEPVYLPGGYRSGALNLDQAYRWYEGYGEGYAGLGEHGQTGENGQLVIRVSPDDMQKLLKSGNRRRLILHATHLIDSEHPVSVRTDAVLYPSEVVIGVRPESYTGRAGEPLGFSVLTLGIDGEPLGGQALEARFQNVSWEEEEGDGFYLGRSKAVFTTESSSSLRTGPDGRARLSFTPSSAGLYQLEVTGGGAVTQALIWTGGASDPSWPRLPDQRLQLQADQAQYLPGQTAKVFVPNPFGPGAQVLVTVERGRVMRSEVLETEGAGLELDIPIQPEDAPNVFVSVILIGRTSGGQPDFRAGYIELAVDPAALLLDVTLESDPLRSEPGGEVTLSLLVRDAAGQPVQGEFSLSLVDKALLALSGPNARPITEAYYGRQGLSVTTALSLAAYNRRVNMTAPEAGGRGGGDQNPGSAVRERFQDTAHWSGSVITGADGRAEVRVSLPDNVTTWVAQVRGLDMDARVGEAALELVSTRDLLVRPQAPRFLVAGDRVTLGAHVHNNTAGPLEVTVRLDASGITLDEPGAAERQVEIDSGGQVYVTWSGEAQAVESVNLVFSARAGDLRDAARPEGGPLPVLRYRVPATYGTAGTLSEAGERLEVIALPRSFTPLGGSLTVELSPSLAAALLAALEARPLHALDFTEALLSSFLPNVQALAALRSLGYASPEVEARLEEEIRAGIDALERAQNDDGGWGIFNRARSNTHITAYALFGLATARAGGQDVDEDKFERARAYLLTNMKVPDAGTRPAELDALAFQNFALQQAGAQDPGLERLVNFYEDMSPWAQGLLALTLAGNDPQDARPREIVMHIKDAVRRSATGVHWEGRNAAPGLFSTPTFNNAVVIYTLAKLDPATPMLPEAVRYLLASRSDRGAWATSYETAWSLLALTQALLGTADVQASYRFAASLDGEEIAGGQASIGALEPALVEVGLDELRPGMGSQLRITRGEGSGRLYYRAFLQLYRPAESAEPLDRGVHVERRYYTAHQDCRQQACEPQEAFEIQPGQQVLVRITLTVPETMHYLVVEDFIPAGAEIVDMSLLTSTQDPQQPRMDAFDQGWNAWVFGLPKIYRDRAWWIAEEVPPGTYEITYYLQPLFKGEFRALPAHAYQYYFPDVEGASAGSVVTFR